MELETLWGGGGILIKNIFKRQNQYARYKEQEQKNQNSVHGHNRIQEALPTYNLDRDENG
jgi:hypothetical protein